MKIVPIRKNGFPLWEKMRKDLYRTLDDVYYLQEMVNIFESDIWYCQFIEDENIQ